MVIADINTFDILIPATMTFLVGILTWWSNKKSRERETRQREIELNLSKDEQELNRLKTVLDAYEEQMLMLRDENKDLHDKQTDMHELIIDLRTAYGKLEIKMARMEAEVEACHSERDALKVRVMELESALG